MAKIVYTGLESSGKSLILAWQAMRILERNKVWEKKYGIERLVYSNIKFSPLVEKKYLGKIIYWEDIRNIQGKTGIDIIWDEISTDLSAMKKEPLPRKLNRWLRQGSKQGVHIYATAQEFHDIHLDFRRRIHQAYFMTRIFGYRRSGENIPPLPRLSQKVPFWGLCIKRELTIHPYNELEPQMGFPIPFMILKQRTEVFDTNQTIQSSEELPYEHIEYKCELEHKSGERCKHLKPYQRVKHR